MHEVPRRFISIALSPVKMPGTNKEAFLCIGFHLAVNFQRIEWIVTAETFSAPSPSTNIQLYLNLDCCDLHLATSTCTIALVTSMVPVTRSVRSGRVSSFLLMQRIGCAVHHQPDPVGVRGARRMLNKLMKIRIRHRRQDRLCGVTPPSHGGNQQADLNHPYIHTTTARGACCREAVKGEVRLVDLSANQKPISHQPKHNSRVSISLRLSGIVFLYLLRCSLSTTKSNPTHSYFH